ncbi:hypothetical protein BDN67DRAFT_1010477 [Paxillus ammoniavirescens]|nr:hypothetical protein BDN67DRAFT_1010477 [Paxillus ammoniavirescens]
MTITIVNTFRKAKTINKHENSVDVGTRECPPPQGRRSNSKIFRFGKSGVHRETQPEERAETTSPLPVGAFTNIQAKQQQQISGTVNSLKEGIKKIFKRPGGTSPTVLTNKSALEYHAVSNGKVPAPDGELEERVIPSLHPSPVLTASTPRNVVHGVCMPLAHVWGSSGAIASLVPCGEHPMGVHLDGSVSCAVAEPPSPLLSSQLLVVSHTVEPESDTNIYISSCVSSEFPMIEEEDLDAVSSLAYCTPPNSSMQNIQSLDLKQAMPAVAPSVSPAHVDEEVDVEELRANQDALTARSSPCVPLGESESEAELNAMWEAEFAAFEFDSGNLEEWTDEVEMAKQAKYDAHFAYAEKALAVPVPKLSSFFSSDSLAKAVHDFIKDHSPTRTQSSESSRSSTLPDTSLATTINLDDSPHQPLAAKIRGLRRIPKHLKNSQVPATGECILSPDLSCRSLDLPGSDVVTVLEIGAAPLRRTEKCSGMKRSFLSFRGKLCSLGKAGEGKDLRSWVTLSGTLGPSRSSRSEAIWTSNESQEVSAEPSISHSRHLLQAAFRPSCSTRTAVLSSRPSPPLSSSSSSVWSCAKITQATNGKRRKRMTKESMKSLKRRLDSMDIDPWY